MKWLYGFLALLLAIFLIDVALAHWQDYAKRRELRIQAKALRKWNMAAFRGARKSTWLS
jgi:hypothetical protein